MVRVEGRTLPTTNANFEQRCFVHLEEEQAKINPDNSLIALLCDAVRLSREFTDFQRNSTRPRAIRRQQVGQEWYMRNWNSLDIVPNCATLIAFNCQR